MTKYALAAVLGWKCAGAAGLHVEDDVIVSWPPSMGERPNQTTLNQWHDDFGVSLVSPPSPAPVTVNELYALLAARGIL